MMRLRRRVGLRKPRPLASGEGPHRSLLHRHLDPDSLTLAQVELLETIADVRLKDSSDEGATLTVRKALGVRKTSGAFDKWLKKRGVKAPRGLDERAKVIVSTAKSL